VPWFSDLFSVSISGLERIRCSRGLDKILGETGFSGFIGGLGSLRVGVEST
jgi:hypothetical protein